ncbi:MAG: hypothetical protein CMQ44_00655 [Gammaproteobacteria bacterium]|nr:hypothetical protein [Gammaproteobacteria bacterium]
MSVGASWLWHNAAVDVPALIIFLLITLLGSYIQAVAGFAMGMLIVAVAGGLRLVEIETLAAVVSILSLTNSALSLWGQTQHVHWRLFVWLAAGQLPALVLGLYFLDHLGANSRWLLELCLGLFLTMGALGMLLKPKPLQHVSPSWVAWLTGLCGGTLGGMFSASGPVLGLFGFSQPLPLNVIRATLLSSFLLVTSSRTLMVGWRGELTEPVLLIVAMALPVVLIGTWWGRIFAPPVSDAALKRAAFWLILVMGVWVGGTAVMSGTLAR